jgi:DNA-binding NarL/FixJ family response regulator
MMTSTVRIAIVEDDPKLREEFAVLVSSAGDMACVSSFGTAEAALAALVTDAPDVLLIDINLPGMSGIHLVGQLRERSMRAQILMLTTFDDATSVFESLRAGANGYVLKRAARGELVHAIRDVMAGGAPMTSAIARKVVQYFGRRDPAPEIATLSDREHEVLVALSQGLQYKEVAANLGISINTVRNYVRTTYDKLHVNSRRDAIEKLGRA